MVNCTNPQCNAEITDANRAVGRSVCRDCWNAYKREQRKKARPVQSLVPAGMDAKKAAFLDELMRNGGFVAKAIKTVGTSRDFVNTAYNTDPNFGLLWDTIIELGNEAIESEIYRRAVLGNEKPLTHLGMLTGDSVKEYSDNLLMFLAKARMPTKYRDLPQKGAELSDEEIQARLEQFIAKRVGKGKAVAYVEGEVVN